MGDLVFPLLALFVVVVYLVNRIRRKNKFKR
jgi:flagellar biogenesis protein FliO